MKEVLIINLISKDMFIGLIYCTKIEIVDSTTAYIYNKSDLISSIEFEKIERTEKNIYNFYTKAY